MTHEPTTEAGVAEILNLPWKVSRSIEGDFLAVYPDTGKPEFPICKKPEFMRDDVWARAARMIASTPALLEVLESAREFVDNYSDVNDGDYGVAEPNKAMRLLSEIDAALSRAKGEG